MSTHSFRPQHPLLLCIFGVLLTACATVEEEFIPSGPAAIHSAARAVLDQAVFVQALTERCGRLGGDVEFQALDTEQNWLALNWPTVAAADRYFSLELQPDTQQHLDKSFALEAVYLSHAAQQRALGTLDLERRTTNNQHLTCARELKRLEDSGMGLAADEAQQRYLDYLVAEYPNEASRIAPVPTLAARIPLDIPPGRSFYAQHEQLKQECPSVELIVLHNGWPQEAYAAYCEKLPLAFVSCEWGNCQSVEM